MGARPHADDADQGDGGRRQGVGDGFGVGRQVVIGAVIDEGDLIAGRVQLPRKLVQPQRGAPVQLIAVAVVAAIDDGGLTAIPDVHRGELGDVLAPI